jgi:hypothetical protein
MSQKPWHGSADAERATRAALTKTLRCVECQRAWLVSRERWRVYLVGVSDGTPSLTFPFCPACALRLFGEL